ncbi:hypothetical protein JCM15765_31400 [Paradesulfitobacterium aromaticivorans]
MKRKALFLGIGIIVIIILVLTNRTAIAFAAIISAFIMWIIKTIKDNKN